MIFAFIFSHETEADADALNRVHLARVGAGVAFDGFLVPEVHIRTRTALAVE